MYTDNKVRTRTEITTTGEHAPYSAFYVFLIPKTAASPTSTVMQGKVILDPESAGIPIVINHWNPIVVTALTISEADLTNYRIFAGAE